MVLPYIPSRIIAKNMVRLPWYTIKFYNGYMNFENKEQWKIKRQFSKNNEWLPTSIDTQVGHYEQQSVI